MTSLVSRAHTTVAARPWIAVLVVVVVAGGSVAGYLLTGDSSGAQPSTTGTTGLVAATTGTIRQAVSTTGTFTPADEDDVSFSASAQVTSVRVAVGDHVRAGQVLGTIDPLNLQSALAQAKATLATAQATLTNAQDSGTATDDEITADEAAVATAKNSVTAAGTALAGATLRSPIAGTVAAVNVAAGDMASGSGGSGSGSANGNSSGAGSGIGGGSGSGIANGTARGSASGTGAGSQNGSSGSGASSGSSSADFVVLGLHKWTVAASVDDTEVGLIKKGDQVQLTTDNSSATIFGTVASVSVLASTSSGSAAYPVTIDVTGTPSGLHDGASANVSIIYRQLSNVLTVPTLAVHRTGSSAYVYVSAHGGKQKRTVTTGLSSGGTTQILSGLTSGEQVYVQVPSVVGTNGGSGTTRNGTGNGTGNGRFPGGGSGRFPGGGFPGGGFPGGGGNGGGNVVQVPAGGNK